MHAIDIRQSRPDDMAFIERLYPAAFPNEDLLPLVRTLLAGEPEILSLLASIDGALAGHILFTICGITGTPANAALLAPLAVASEWQKQGVGTALIREGLDRLEQAGVAQIFVLGDPAYYRRSGFKVETAIAPPYPLPGEWRGAWQSLSLGGATPPSQGKLLLPEVWLQPALWGV